LIGSSSKEDNRTIQIKTKSLQKLQPQTFDKCSILWLIVFGFICVIEVVREQTSNQENNINLAQQICSSLLIILCLLNLIFFAEITLVSIIKHLLGIGYSVILYLQYSGYI
jgi:uncharacterized membrane protein YiaA